MNRREFLSGAVLLSVAHPSHEEPKVVKVSGLCPDESPDGDLCISWEGHKGHHFIQMKGYRKTWGRT